MRDLPLDLEALEELIRKSKPDQVNEFIKLAEHKLIEAWLSQPGPQTEAYFSEADELLYGGAVGGGKTDLLVGLSTTAHLKSLIFRAQSKDLDGFWSRLREVVPTPSSSNDVKRYIKTPDGRTIEGGHLEKPGSERDWQGRPHDFIGFDEAAQLAEQRVAFVLQWLRSTTPGQRQRAVFATNPPLPEIGPDGKIVDTGLGDWLKRWFAPWVDDRFPNPAKPGELRWCFMRTQGDRLETVWVEGPGCYDPETAEHMPDATQEDIDRGRVSVAKSRTFIRSLLTDNIYLKGTGYAERLSGTPEPLKSMLLNGDFTVRGEDHPLQVIPTQWAVDAQERWKDRDEDDVMRLRQIVLYGDVAQGGVDTTVLAPLFETDYYDELITQPGRKTPTGVEIMRMLLDERLDNSLIALDGTGGWAGSARDLLSTHHDIDVEMHTVSKVDGSWTPDMLYKYLNLRTKMWWEFRLALDPKSGYKICLPPSSRLLTQLTTPHFKIRGKELQVESKEDVAKRIGGSTDEADAVLGAWQYREQALLALLKPTQTLIERLNTPPAERERNARHGGNAQEFDDPLKGW